VERLKRLLTNPARPVQIVIAGKALPLDEPGKMLIREIVQFSRDPEVSRRVVFVEDYGVEVARELVQGVDLWLNNPARGEEACGTSGMKAGINGVLNMSILDGWFDEAYEISGGWAIGSAYPTRPTRMKCMPGPSIRCSRTRSSHSTTIAVRTVCRPNG
jgi:starch phosphorylase